MLFGKIKYLTWLDETCECRLFYLPFMGTLSFVFWIYGSHHSHTAWWKPIFIDNCYFCKRIIPKIICNPDLIFRLPEHLVTLTLYTTLSWYHLEEIYHPELIFWPSLLFGTWEHSGIPVAIMYVPATYTRRPRGALGDLTALLSNCCCEPTASSWRSFRLLREHRATVHKFVHVQNACGGMAS